MQLYLAATPQILPQLRRFPWPIAHVAYGVDESGHLTRSQFPAQVRGGLMALHDQNSRFHPDSSDLCRDILYECHARGYQGVLADFSPKEQRHRQEFLQRLDEQLHSSGRTLYVPEACKANIQHGSILICTAISGGTLRQRLQEAIQTWSVQRLAMDLQRLCMDFPLPCPSGEGQPISPETLAAGLAQHNSAVFYSAELCARYFTTSQPDGHHFTLFDDANTLRRKIQLGQELGIRAGFLMYPEVSDLLPELVAER